MRSFGSLRAFRINSTKVFFTAAPEKGQVSLNKKAANFFFEKSGFASKTRKPRFQGPAAGIFYFIS